MRIESPRGLFKLNEPIPPKHVDIEGFVKVLEDAGVTVTVGKISS